MGLSFGSAGTKVSEEEIEDGKKFKNIIGIYICRILHVSGNSLMWPLTSAKLICKLK
jgi:hypothetical protein